MPSDQLPTVDTKPPHLAVVMSFSGQGGVERMVTNLIREFAEAAPQRLRLDVLTIKASGPHLEGLPDNINVISLKAKHSLTSIPELVMYLRHERPNAVLVAKDRAGRAVLLARLLARVPVRVVVRLGTNLSAALAHKNILQRWLRVAPMRWIYRSVDRVVAVSEGVKDDVLATTGLAEGVVEVVRNPVITPDFFRKAQAPCPHPWFVDGRTPVLIGIGRLSEQKDFSSLLRAFAKARQVREMRLVILGEGGKRAELQDLMAELGIADAVLLPGFQENPYCWLSRAQLFVLSSRWEGSPNVLTEAMALGVPVVATRCPSGPSEVLDNGRIGRLVSIGDISAMANAIVDKLDKPDSSARLKAAVQNYRSSVSAAHYISVLDLPRITED